MWSRVVLWLVRVLFLYFQQIESHRSVMIQRERLKLIAPTAMQLYICAHTLTHTHTQAPQFALKDALLWEDWSERGGLQQTVSPEAALLRERQKKDNSSINSRGISLIRVIHQPAAVVITLSHTHAHTVLYTNCLGTERTRRKGCERGLNGRSSTFVW